jgi:hypothetical protein
MQGEGEHQGIVGSAQLANSLPSVHGASCRSSHRQVGIAIEVAPAAHAGHLAARVFAKIHRRQSAYQVRRGIETIARKSFLESFKQRPRSVRRVGLHPSRMRHLPNDAAVGRLFQRGTHDRIAISPHLLRQAFVHVENLPRSAALDVGVLDEYDLGLLTRTAHKPHQVPLTITPDADRGEDVVPVDVGAVHVGGRVVVHAPGAVLRRATARRSESALPCRTCTPAGAAGLAVCVLPSRYSPDVSRARVRRRRSGSHAYRQQLRGRTPSAAIRRAVACGEQQLVNTDARAPNQGKHWRPRLSVLSKAGVQGLVVLRVDGGQRSFGARAWFVDRGRSGGPSIRDVDPGNPQPVGAFGRVQFAGI